MGKQCEIKFLAEAKLHFTITTHLIEFKERVNICAFLLNMKRDKEKRAESDAHCPHILACNLTFKKVM